MEAVPMVSIHSYFKFTNKDYLSPAERMGVSTDVKLINNYTKIVAREFNWDSLLTEGQWK